MDDEQRVDTMIANGMRIVQEAIAEHKPAAIVAAFSSGDDSIVSTHFTMNNVPGAFVFNASTKVALAPSRAHLHAVCDRFGWPLEVGEAYAEGPPKKMRKGGHLVPFDPKEKLAAGHWVDGASAYEEFVLNFGFPGRGKPQHALAYSRLKERPFRRMLRRFKASPVAGKPKVLILSGIRADESEIRAGYKRVSTIGFFGDVWLCPFYWHTAVDFEAYRQEFGLPRNPVKRQCGISGECCCGTFSNINERAAYKVVDPEFEAYLTHLESRVRANGLPWGWGESPPREWVREREDKRRGQLNLFEGRGSTFQPMCVGCANGRR